MLFRSEFGQPKYPYLECKARDITYSAPIYAYLRLNRKNGGMMENKIYMGELPLMTSSGTFIINGAERVIVSYSFVHQVLTCLKLEMKNLVNLFMKQI